MINPWLIVGLLLAAIAEAGVCLWYGYGAGRDAAVADQAERAQIIRDVQAAAERGAAAQIAKLEVQHVQITQPLEREIRENVVYRDCVHTADGLRLVNAALAGTGPAGDRELPGPRAADRPDIRRDGPKTRASGDPVPHLPDGGPGGQ